SLSGLVLMLLYYFLFSEKSDILQIVGNFLSILTPIFFAIAFAYLINFILKMIENIILKKLWDRVKNNKIKRVVSLILTYIITISLVTGFIWIVLPQVIESLENLAKKIPEYYNEYAPMLQEFLTTTFKDFAMVDLNQLFSTLGTIINNISQTLISLLPKTFDILTSTVGTLSNIIIGFMISVYLLLSKEKFMAQSKKIITAIFPEKFHDGLFETLSLTNTNFGGYLSGKLLSSLIIGAGYYLIFAIAGVKYAILFAVILAVFNMIPFFGPVIGAVPCLLIVLIDKPWQIWIVIIAIAVMQLIEGNILSPKLIGQNTGLTAFWILFAILLFGGIWGIMGMIIAVPIFSVLYTAIKRGIEKKLKKKDLPVKTISYADENNPIVF
ncbi:MAG: AI-2E family transporter, partial [Oscillospiraceae bacterium]